MTKAGNSQIMRTITLLITILSLSLPAYAQYSGGTGEPNNPYQIATAEDLMLLGETPEDYDKYFILTADIDLDPNLPERKVFDRAVIAPDTDNSRGDFQGAVFGGVFDGNDHIINNLTIDTAGVAKDYLALFGEIRGENAEVKNISIVNHKIITGDGYPEFSGGLVGRNFNGSISNCCAIGSITGGDSAENFGGLCGHNDFGTISDCYAAGSVTGSGCDYLGGLCGQTYGNIINCYATTTVVGKGESWNLGGLCGDNTGTISNCYAKGSVISRNDDSVYLGGLCGENSGLISDCYTAGVVDVGNGSDFVGGLCGENNIKGYISNCFWDVDISGQTTSDGGTGKTSAEMQTATTFLEAGWDFVDETVNGPNDIWKISEGLDYPRLWWEKYGSGTGEPNDPYLIYTAEHLNELGAEPNDYDKHFKLMADIDLSGYTYDRAVIAPDMNDTIHPWYGAEFDGTSFTGVFDGDGHVISNLSIVGKSYLGLFGNTGSRFWPPVTREGAVINLGLEAVDIGGDGEYIGGLVGQNLDIIDKCYVTGSISGQIFVGGLAGANRYNGTITCCYSRCSVVADDVSGGLLGINAGYSGQMVPYRRAVVSDCYSIVLGGSRVAGLLVGQNSKEHLIYDSYPSLISNCYSYCDIGRSVEAKGLVGENIYFDDGVVLNCYWDASSCGLIDNTEDGTPKTTAEMKLASTFSNWGVCGGEPVWTIDEGNDYPRLWWEDKPGKVIEPVNLYDFIEGTGTEEDPYLIYNAEDLNMISLSVCALDKHFKLMADIDLIGYSYNAALIAPDAYDKTYWSYEGTAFSGVFDGNGHRISHLMINGIGYVGLFGQISPEGEVRNLGLTDLNIICSGSHIGGLVADNKGYIFACYSNGTISGEVDTIGGLVGLNDGNIKYSYSEAAIIGKYTVGGLVGTNYRGPNYSGSIFNCYSTGPVSGIIDVGGLVGVSYSGRDVANSFWDNQTSNQSTSAVGIGKTTAEMQTASTFLGVGWDFVNETVNGPNDIWKMWDEYDYPRLAWEPGPNIPLVFVDINDPGFYGQMSKYEVTNDQYCDFLNAALASGDITVDGTDVAGANGSNSGEDYVGQRYYRCDGSGYTGYGATNGGATRIHYNEGAFSVDNGFGNHPVTYVSWYGATAFANYYGYYLPTEDQWQAVADYYGTYIYGCGETIDPDIANYRYSEHPDGTTSVGSFGIYGYGMSDMAGNVWEWTSSSLESNRIFRGGSLGSYDYDCAVSIRGDGIPYANYYDIGFRVCR